MTRWAIAVLLLLNWALGAWNFGAFSRWGWAPDDGREPERLARQIQPDAVRLSLAEAPVAVASSPQTPASTATAARPDTPASVAVAPASTAAAATPSPR